MYTGVVLGLGPFYVLVMGWLGWLVVSKASAFVALELLLFEPRVSKL